jgi:COMPASS component SWD2
MNPVNDTFVSAGLDYSLRCWDLRDPKCGALLRYKSATPHLPCVAFDPAGLLFAMSSASGVIKMFDTTNLSAGPFASFQLPEDTMGDISAIKFSHSGTQMLVSSLQGSLALVDAFNGKTERIISGFKNEHRSILEPSFSPDGKFVFSGAENGSIHCWSAIDGVEVAHWEGVHPGPVQCLAWNPVNLTFASACSNLGLWVRNEPTDAMDIS